MLQLIVQIFNFFLIKKIQLMIEKYFLDFLFQKVLIKVNGKALIYI